MESGELVFGPFTLSRTRSQLLRQAVAVPLGARSLALLEMLVERAGDVVGARDIAARLWPGEARDQSRLRAEVSTLRRALGDGREGNRYIVNVLARGYVFVAPVRREPGAAPASAAHAPGLPAGPAALLGRDEAIAALEVLVAQRRLVSIVGAAGLGKSALALAVARRCAPGFADGVAWVDLAPLADGAPLAGAVAAALGLAWGPADGLPALCADLAERRLLLVLDNCGHLADAAALLAEALLAAAPRVHLLVSSREALSLDTEWVHRLAPLTLPQPALSLFAQRLADCGGAALDLDGLRGAAQLCYQLDGNPLLIGLAAAQAAGGATVDGSVERLFAPAAPGMGRHQSPAALFDSSLRLLAERERIVLRRLSVFCGAFTLDWGGQVCACPRIGADAVREAVLALSARSLVEVEVEVDSADSAARYRLGRAMRRHARRLLAEAGEEAPLAASHARSMLALYRGADADLQRLGAMEWRARYAGSLDDFGAALDWALGADGEPMLGIELTALSWFVMIETGCIDVHRRRVALALEALARLAQPRPDLELQLLASLLMLLALLCADPDGAAAVSARLDALARSSPDARQAALALHALVAWRLGQGDYPGARRLAERIAPLAARVGEPVALALAFRFRAQALHFLGLHDEAARTAAAVIESVAPQRNVHYLGPAPRALAMLAVQARSAWIGGRPDTAQALAGETLAAAEGQHPFALCQAVCMAALPVALWRGDAAGVQALCARLAGAIDGGASAYWRPWLAVLGSAPASRCLPVPLRDLLATVEPDLADRACLRRVRKGLVGWCAPEVLRAHGEQLRRAGWPDAQVERVWLEARALARRQHALGWELRIATSLAGLWAGSARERQGLDELERLYARFDQGRDTADLARARACFTPFHILEAPAQLACPFY